MSEREVTRGAALELTSQQFDELLALARLEVDAEQRQALAGDLRALLGFVEELFNAPIPDDEVADAAAGDDAPTPGRGDAITAPLARDAALANAPAAHEGYFKVPRTVDEG